VAGQAEGEGGGAAPNLSLILATAQAQKSSLFLPCEACSSAWTGGGRRGRVRLPELPFEEKVTGAAEGP